MLKTGILIAICFLLFTLTGKVQAVDYYVSPLGNDANSGLGVKPNQAFKTIQAAVNRLEAGDQCLVLGGIYRETVVFPKNGTPGRPITLVTFKSQKVVVSGCNPISGWTKFKGSIWKANMPWTLGTGRNQVFTGDKVMVEARYPNVPDPGLGMYVGGLSPLWPTFGEFSIPDGVTAPGRITSKLLDGFPENYWKGALYYGVHYEGWAGQTGVIETSKPGEITVGDRTQGWWFGSAYGGGYRPEEGRGMIVGHMNALDKPVEWHWQDNTLYCIPPTGTKPVNIEAKHRQLAFDLSGREYINIEGITVKAGSMRLLDSSNCVVKNCNLSYISQFIRMYEMGQVEHGRDTIKSGETGIYVGGHDNSFLNCSIRFSAGAGFYLRGYHHTIHNCLIDEVDYTSHYLNAITDAVSDYPDYENMLVGGHVITYNTMRNAGRHFFNFYGNGTSLSSRDRGPLDYMATLFVGNHLYNGMLETKDAGFITGYYSSGGTLDGLNSKVAYNVMHDTYDIFGMRIKVLGIVYLDAGTCDVDLYNNLLWAAPGSHQLGLWYNTMCVDVHEHDNFFHPEFKRTSAELKPADFPNGKPFRFGHDFANPPPLPSWPQIVRTDIPAAKQIGEIKSGDSFNLGDIDSTTGWQSMIMSFASDNKDINTDKTLRATPRHHAATDPLVMESEFNDGLHPKIRSQWSFIYNTPDGSWVRFNKVPLGEGYKRFRVIYGNSQTSPRYVEVHLDNVDGPLVGHVDLPQTDKPRPGNIQIYQMATGEISADAKGTHDIYLVFRSEDGKLVGEFEYFRFEQYRGLIPLQKNEVKLELRLGSKDGEKIGEFYPRSTGGKSIFKQFVANIEPVKSKQPLYLVVRSEAAGTFGTINSMRCEKAKQPIDWTGVGVPPLKKNGKYVFPAPTNRPIAKPNDKYKNSTGSTRPKGIAAANWLDKAPVIDGKLNDWTKAGHVLKMTETYDGSASKAPASEAWVGYDYEALYIAVKNPVKDVKTLSFTDHKWGVTDAMEVAIQDTSAAKPGPIMNMYGWPDGHFESTDQTGAPEDVVARLGKAVTYKAAIGESEWTCEWRIPFTACGFSPKTASSVLFNLAVRKIGQNEDWVIWRGTGGATYMVENAGILIFPKEFLKTASIPKNGLQVWLDASDSESVQIDSDGLVPVWRDRSGNARDAWQDQAENRPAYLINGLNNRPALGFTEDRLTRLDMADLSSEKISGAVITVFSNPKPGLEVNHDPRIFTSSDGKDYDYLTGICAGVTGMETGGPRMQVFPFSQIWAKAVHIGCFSPTYQTFFTGSISEILVYNRVLTNKEMEQIRAYLMLKWDLE